MYRMLTLLLPVSLLLMGCSPNIDDLVAYTEEVKQRPHQAVEPYPEFKPEPAFVYSAGELRSPFNPSSKAMVPIAPPAQTNCLQPDFSRAKQPLEQYGIDALSLTGNFTTNGVRWVLFKTNNGELHKATQGSRLGLFFGKIIAISDSSVTIEELLPDGAGCWQRQETELSLKPREGENNNV